MRWSDFESGHGTGIGIDARACGRDRARGGGSIVRTRGGRAGAVSDRDSPVRVANGAGRFARVRAGVESDATIRAAPVAIADGEVAEGSRDRASASVERTVGVVAVGVFVAGGSAGLLSIL